MKGRLKRKKFRGLTLIELLIAITVFGLLVLFSTIAVQAQLKKGRDARRKADFQKIKTALYDYYFDADCFPEDLPECGDSFGSDSMAYLNNFPCDPLGEPYVYAITKKGGGKCSQWFRLFTNLEVTTDPIIDRIHCRQGCGPDKNNCIYNYGVASTNTQVYRDCSFAYVCNPGGNCQGFEDPWRSECPVIYSDPNCNGECSKKKTDNRCKNDSGKQVPEE